VQALTVDELRSVIAHETAPCISIYMPTRRGGSAEDRAKFAGHMREAHKLLTSEHSHAQIDDLLAPVKALDENGFWEQQLEGLAVFRSAGFLAYYPIPLAVDHLTVVADSFHVRPVLRFLQSNQRYYLLNLSLGRASFFKGSAMGLGPVNLSKLPQSLAESAGNNHGVHAEQSPGGRSSGAAGGKIAHDSRQGQGKLENSQPEEIARYFRAIDKALWEILRDETAPLIVAATEQHHPQFASISRYPHLLRDGLNGNFENTPLKELHAKAWPVVQRHIVERENEVIEHYGNSIKRKRSTDEIHSVSAAAVQGRVRELLVVRDAHLWGRMDSTTGAVQLHSNDGKTGQKDAHDDDVIDDIAEAVILRGGAVYSFEKDRMPTKSPIAAVLRW
jgi:hypothetical protein